MPKNVPAELEEKFASCKEQVMAEGYDESAAYGICYMSVVEGKSIDAAKTGFVLDALKVGMRNSAKDAERLQLIHDMAVENGAQCHEMPEVDEYPILSLDDVMVTGGDAIKAEPTPGGLKVGGLLVRFSTAKDPDVSSARDFFTRETDFDMQFPGSATVYFNHGLDRELKRRKLSRATLTLTDAGVWAETILQERDEYEKAIAKLALDGKLGWSSGTASHLVEREPVEGANFVKRWPLGLDASITPTPAEPRNAVIPLKSLVSGGGAGAHLADKPFSNSEDVKMEFTKEELAGMLSDAAKTAVTEFVAAQPATKNAGFVQVTRDEADHDFANAGEFLMAVKSAAVDRGAIDPRLKSRASEDGYAMTGIKANGLNEAIPSQGGYLVQNGLAAGIIERMYQVGEILSRVSKDPVGANSNGMTYNALDETSRADGSRFGGVQGYWLAEAGTKTASKPKFRQLDLKLKKVIAAAYATDELLQDAVALESWLLRNVPQELQFKVEDAIINGDGAGKPLGILAGPGKVEVSKETNQAAATVNYTNIVKMWARLWAGSRANAVWLINQDVEPQLDQLALAVGTGGIPANYITYGTDGVMRIKGRPVIAVEYCQTLGTVGDIILADLSQYQGIDKGGVQSASSIHVQFLTDETTFRWVYRFDGQPIWNSALTPKNGANSVAPFVTLATRA